MSGAKPRVLARSVHYIHPKLGTQATLLAAFARPDVSGQAMRQEGCLSVEIDAPPDPEGTVLVTALWRRRKDYDGWFANPWRAEASAAIEPRLATEPAGVVYDVVLATESAAMPEGAAVSSVADRPRRTEQGAA